MNVMKYKGYTAHIQYSDEDGCFIGSVLGIRDFIDFEGESVAELETDFHNAIDSYLATCAKIGKTPDKPTSGKMMLRLPVDVYARMAGHAEVTGQSMNQLVVDAIRAAYCVKSGEKPRSKKQAGRSHGKKSRIPAAK